MFTSAALRTGRTSRKRADPVSPYQTNQKVHAPRAVWDVKLERAVKPGTSFERFSYVELRHPGPFLPCQAHPPLLAIV